MVNIGDTVGDARSGDIKIESMIDRKEQANKQEEATYTTTNKNSNISSAEQVKSKQLLSIVSRLDDGHTGHTYQPAAKGNNFFFP